MDAQHVASGESNREALLRPAASALTGILAVACLARFGLSADALIGVFLVVVLVVLSVIDIERRLLPDKIVLPSAAALLAAQIVFAPERAVTHVVAAVGVAAFLLIAAVLSRGGIAMGDVKLGFLLGAALGKAAVAALLFGTLAGGIVSAFILLRGGKEARKRAIPYGPFLAVGGILALLGGNGFAATPF